LLSPRDHFAFTVFADPNGDGAAIITRDNSCTVPQLGAASGDYPGYTQENADGSITRVQPFLPYQYADDEYDAVQRTLAGHVEVIEMGVLNPTGRAADAENGVTAFDPAAYATHDSSGVPADCGALVSAWSTGGDWFGAENANAGVQMLAPSGGLYGLSNMLNNSDAAAYGVEPAAIADFWASDAGEQHTNPGDTLPSLASGDVAAIVPNAGEAFTITYAAADAVDAVSSLFMAESISNDVMVNPDLSGETDWVVTFPTRRYYVNGTTAEKPFTDVYDSDEAPNNACERVVISQVDREESGTDPVVDTPIFSPAPPGADPADLPELCYETNTIAVNGVSAVNATVSTADNINVAVGLDSANAEGWQTISFMLTGGTASARTEEHWLESATESLDGAGEDAAGLRLNGLPVMGFAAFEYTNGSKNFGFVSDHKTSIGGSATSAAAN